MQPETPAATPPVVFRFPLKHVASRLGRSWATFKGSTMSEQLRQIRQRAAEAAAMASVDALEGEPEPAKASEYIDLPNIIPGRCYISTCRVSTPEQAKKGELEQQEIVLTNCIKEGGGIPVQSYKRIGSGSNLSWLKRLRRKAEKLKAIIFAESTDRLLRHPDAHKGWENYRLTPRLEDFEEMKRLLGNIRPMTMLDPDADPERVQSHQRWRGMSFKTKGGGHHPVNSGPGWKKRRRLAKQEQAITLRGNYWSLGKIAKALHVPKSTIQRWVGPLSEVLQGV